MFSWITKATGGYSKNDTHCKRCGLELERTIEIIKASPRTGKPIKTKTTLRCPSPFSKTSRMYEWGHTFWEYTEDHE